MDIRDLLIDIKDTVLNFIYALINLEPGWEKKALIVLGIIVLIITVYAFNPFSSSPNIEVQSGNAYTPTSTPKQAPMVSNNSTSNNTTDEFLTNGTNGTFQISADQAKQIALNDNPGFTAGEPVQGTLTINNNVVSVWKVPLMKEGAQSREVYVNSETGMIAGTKIL